MDTCPTRKRQRSAEEECEECLPISKRINNLHIRQSVDTWTDGQPAVPNSPDNLVPYNNNNNVFGLAPCCQSADQTVPLHQLLPPGEYINTAPGANMTPGGATLCGLQPQQSLISPLPNINNSLNPAMYPQMSMPPGSYNGTQVDCEDYMPELTVSENPHYFQINHLLFDANNARVRRQGSFHPRPDLPQQ